MGSISSIVQNDLEGSLIIYKGYLCELSPESSCVLYTRLLWDIIHSGHKFCAKRLHIVGSETFEGLFC